MAFQNGLGGDPRGQHVAVAAAALATPRVRSGLPHGRSRSISGAHLPGARRDDELSADHA